jgi:hypothetical protein
MMMERVWGSIEILNELRSQTTSRTRIGYQAPPDQQTNILEWPLGPNISESLDNMYLRVEELRHWSDPHGEQKSDTDFKLVDDFLENSLHDDNGLSWGGDPTECFKPILSTHY